MAGVSEVLRQLGWSQGDFIQGAQAVILEKSNLDHRYCDFADPSVLVLISQDCDIVADEVKEPFIEFWVGELIATYAGLCLNGRNPRNLHLPIADKWFSFQIHARVRVHKECLIGVGRVPEGRLGLPELDTLRRWISRRYLRPAFPDQFNERIKAQKKVEEWEKRSAAQVSIVLFRLDTERELDPTTAYGLTIILGYSTLAVPEVAAKTEEDLIAAIECSGIRVDDIVSRLETDITLSHLRTYKRWDRDHRSLPNDPAISGPPRYVDTV